ncbi:MAG: hypothetical protein ACLQJR_28510 [Stellaceae bacterium]
MRVSPDLLNAVAAALPAADGDAIAAREVHDRVGAWNRTTVRHALRELVQSGRASFIGGDRHRKYRSAGGAEPSGAGNGAGQPARPASRRVGASQESWRDYALRGDGSVRLPDGQAVAEAMRKHGLRYGDVDAEELQREERLAGWSCRRPTSAALTSAVFGDPQPSRRRPP